MIWVFYFLAAVLIWFSFKSFTGGIAYIRFFRFELSKPRSEYTPFATVIAPCRGMDEGLDKNLAAIFHQDYPEYEVIFAVDSKDDEAVPVIREMISRFAGPTKTGKIIVGGHDPVNTSKKIEKLREAVLHASDHSCVLVTVDSDVRPSTHWLRDLVAPLEDDSVGAATGYRWFISKKPTFASELKSVWNASIASALGPNTRANFTWGGSTAIRRDVFERIEMREKWAGTLADDFAVTRVLRDERLPIVFVPAALTVSIDAPSLAETIEFTTRQMKITRVYMPHLWLMSFFGSSVFNIAMIWALLIVIFQRNDPWASVIAAMTLVLVSLFSIGKAWLRLNAVRLVLKRYDAELGRQFWTQNTLWIFSPALFLLNCIAALLSRRITWRGTRYELKSPTETVIIRG